MGRATISDVAREAGVSVTTVSRYINGNYQKMSPRTRALIAESVKRLEYHPSASARRMRQQETHVIGLIVGDISNVFSSLLFKGIYRQLQPAGYDVMLMNADNSVIQEHDQINRLLSQQVDGLIVQPSAKHFVAYQSIVQAKKPLVMVDREPEDLPEDISMVTANNEVSCKRLGDHLARLGYSNIVVFSRIGSEISAQTRRIEGFRDSAARNDKLFLHVELNQHDNAWLKQTIATSLKHVKGPTVFISLMGPLLFDILACLRELHIQFPKDVGLVSFDDWRWSQYVADGIYLLEQSPQELGRAAACNLMEQVDATRQVPALGPYRASKRITLDVRSVPARSLRDE
ncbi:LacI family DNA-binding transcriptional regulator [Bifidobacterium aquikefiri]|uniref:LacI family DNA-binding transcriptional regulator n=1 Tax=Bifidobacterium aquikefiri TaxID=1653207 RepID=UPI0039EB8950